ALRSSRSSRNRISWPVGASRGGARSQIVQRDRGRQVSASLSRLQLVPCPPVSAWVAQTPARPASLKSRLLLKPLLRSRTRHRPVRVRRQRKFLRVPRVGGGGHTPIASGLAAAGLPTR